MTNKEKLWFTVYMLGLITMAFPSVILWLLTFGRHSGARVFEMWISWTARMSLDVKAIMAAIEKQRLDEAD